MRPLLCAVPVKGALPARKQLTLPKYVTEANQRVKDTYQVLMMLEVNKTSREMVNLSTTVIAKAKKEYHDACEEYHVAYNTYLSTVRKDDPAFDREAFGVVK
jgi:hypothetical protein